MVAKQSRAATHKTRRSRLDRRRPCSCGVISHTAKILRLSAGNLDAMNSHSLQIWAALSLVVNLGACGSSSNSAASGANAAIGGSSNATGATTGGTASDSGTADAGPFVLSWQDDFDKLNSSMWSLMTFTFATNLAQFSAQNASVSGGILTLNLTNNPNSTTVPYYGVEMRSAKTLLYGKLSARMRFASGSGVVSGLVLFYTPYPNCNWNEIDIEHLGKSPTSSQLNAQVFTGTVVPGCTTSVAGTQDPLVADLGFDAETDFHVYDIEWTPQNVKYYADGNLLRTWDANIALLNQPQTILLTIWASSVASWAGAVDSTSAPTSAQVDWIKVYDYKG
jgi:endo-1,3-1,4-beta-glycanase ExoK